MEMGPCGGIYVNFPLGNSVSLMPMALYSQMGGRYFTDNTGTYKWTQRLGPICTGATKN
jgi:hypothetical protein